MKGCEKLDRLKVKNLCVLHGNIRNLKSENATLENANVTNLQSENANITNATVTNLQTENSTITNLEVETINGRSVECDQTFTNANSFLVLVDPLVYPEGSGFNRQVWDGLVAETELHQTELAQRLQCGRLQEKYIQDLFGCQVCPPNELQNCTPTCQTEGNFAKQNRKEGEDVCACPEEVGECPSIPLRIFGIKTVLPVIVKTCGSSVEQQNTQLISSISYNLDVTNVTGTLATRVVTVLAQVGYLDETGTFVYEEIDFGNRQFGPTLDTAYGEKYTGAVILDSDLMRFVATYPNSGALVQLVVFAEEGVEIDVRSNNRKTKKRGGKYFQDSTPSGSVDTQYIGTEVGGQLQWANIYSYYSTAVANITILESSLNLSKSAPSTQWVMGWLFVGETPAGGAAGGYFGINTNDAGIFQFLGSIFNVALSAEVGESYVTAEKFGGEGEGWSLRITPENISNFPVNLNETYRFRLERTELATETTWKFTITNETTSAVANLGTIKTPAAYSLISQGGLYQFSEYFGRGPPAVTCATIPQSIATWTYLKLNDQPNSSTYVAWTPPPQHCGAYTITPNLPNGPVVMTFGSS